MSGNGTVDVHFESVLEVETRIGTAIKNLTGRLHDLDGSLSPIVQFWTGDAREAYYADKKQWDKAADDMNAVLTEIKKAVSAAHEEYVHVNQQTKALFG